MKAKTITYTRTESESPLLIVELDTGEKMEFFPMPQKMIYYGEGVALAYSGPFPKTRWTTKWGATSVGIWITDPVIVQIVAEARDTVVNGEWKNHTESADRYYD